MLAKINQNGTIELHPECDVDISVIFGIHDVSNRLIAEKKCKAFHNLELMDVVDLVHVDVGVYEKYKHYHISGFVKNDDKNLIGVILGSSAVSKIKKTHNKKK